MTRILAAIVFFSFALSAMADERIQLKYSPGPVANPLRGLVPYASDSNDHFPHSMEFNYIGFAELMSGYDEFDWRPLENLLNQIAGRRHQAVFRIYLEYPGKSNVIPKFLLADGLKVHRYLNTNTQPSPPAKVETPDYEDKNLRRALRNFIAALGKKYDGDPRIGFVTAGLLGTWGEWHTYPKEELFASKTVQTEVMDAYEAAFRVTPVLLRYPAGEANRGKASNAGRPFGYHDDSFAWSTLDTGKKEDDWFYMAALKKAGPSAMEKWRMHPIGGEIRPEAWGKVFDSNPGERNIQDFRKCVEQTHASWLMDTGMFKKGADQERRKRAEVEARRLGYEFHVPALNVSRENNKLTIQLELQNRGVAPFYYDWKAEYGLIANGKVHKTSASTGKLTGLLPGDVSQVWRDVIDLSDLSQGKYYLAVRVPNTMPNGLPLKFSNETQDRDLDGWLSLTNVDR